MDWSVEAGVDDPVLVVPWASLDGTQRFVDLRKEPARLKEISESCEYSAIGETLLRLNGAGSPVWTAKCDAWSLSEQERAALQAELEAEEEAAGFASYVDMLMGDADAFRDFHALEHKVRHWARELSSREGAAQKVEFVLRPALVDDVPGFAVTTYVFALGSDAHEAQERWAAALEAVVEEIRRYNGAMGE